MAGEPMFVFETGGTTGVPKSRVASATSASTTSCSATRCPRSSSRKGSNWLMLGPSGPRRLRLSVEHLAQYRGGICFCIDLDPRWVIKLIQKGWTEHLKAYKAHCIDQAVTILGRRSRHQVHVRHAEADRGAVPRLEEQGTTLRKRGVLGIFAGGTEFTPQWTRFAVEELLDGIYITPTYGNTLMGLAGSKPVTREDGYKITYYAPQPRAVIEVVDPDQPDRVVGYGETGRVRLTTLTREFFVPGFLERDEGEREPPYEQYPWDGVSGVRPFADAGGDDDGRRVLAGRSREYDSSRASGIRCSDP